MSRTEDLGWKSNCSLMNAFLSLIRSYLINVLFLHKQRSIKTKSLEIHYFSKENRFKLFCYILASAVNLLHLLLALQVIRHTTEILQLVKCEVQKNLQILIKLTIF